MHHHRKRFISSWKQLLYILEHYRENNSVSKKQFRVDSNYWKSIGESSKTLLLLYNITRSQILRKSNLIPKIRGLPSIYWFVYNSSFAARLKHWMRDLTCKVNTECLLYTFVPGYIPVISHRVVRLGYALVWPTH